MKHYAALAVLISMLFWCVDSFAKEKPSQALTGAFKLHVLPDIDALLPDKPIAENMQLSAQEDLPIDGGEF